MSERTKATILVKGAAEGEVLVLDKPLSVSDGLNLTNGMIIDKWHPQYDTILSGKILSMESGRKSSSGNAVLAEALRKGTGPCGILLSQRDGIVSVGAIVANNLYDVGCPVILLPRDERPKFQNSKCIKIAASSDDATIEQY